MTIRAKTVAGRDESIFTGHPSAADAPGRTRARALAKRALRAVGVASAGLRRQPDFLIIGAKRAGTTWLYAALLEHPQVLPMFPSATVLPLRTHPKGVHYFDIGYDGGERWYRSHFPTAGYRRVRSALGRRPVVAGEASPYYLFHPLAASRAACELPAARIVVMLRDPVERAFSHYKEQRALGNEPLPRFEDALAAEDDRLAGEHERLTTDTHAVSIAHEHQSYVAQGRYADCLARWMRAYPATSVSVLFSAELFADPQGGYDRLCRFLGLGQHPLRSTRRLNASVSEVLDPPIAERLRCYYAPYDAALAELLGRELPWPTLGG